MTSYIYLLFQIKQIWSEAKLRSGIYYIYYILIGYNFEKYSCKIDVVDYIDYFALSLVSVVEYSDFKPPGITDLYYVTGNDLAGAKSATFFGVCEWCCFYYFF